MANAALSDAIYSRLSRHFVRRLRHAQAAAAINAAADQEVLAAVAFPVGGEDWFAFYPGPAAARITEAEITRIVRDGRRRDPEVASRYVVDHGEVMLIEDDFNAPKKLSGGRSLSKESLLTKGAVRTNRRDTPAHQIPMSHLLKLIREAADPPRSADVATLLLIANAVARSGLTISEVLNVLRRPRPIISVSSPVRWFEDHFVDLLDRSFILPGATVRSDGMFASAEVKAALKQGCKRHVISFRGKTLAQNDLDLWTLHAARRNLPILCVAETSGTVPPRLAMAANLVLECGPLNAAILRDTIMAVLGDVPEAALAGVDCSLLDLIDVAVAIGPGNTPHDAATILAQLAAARLNGASGDNSSQGRAGSHVKDDQKLAKSEANDRRGDTPRTGCHIILPSRKDGSEPDGFVPAIEILSGFGEAAVWATNLKVDLAKWQSGEVAWDQLASKILLSGPPGTGKTMFAHALCNSLQIPALCTSVSTWLDPVYLGDAIRRMKQTFEEAQALSPAILFIDGIDGIGSRVGSNRDHADYWNSLVNTLLELLSGVTPMKGVIVVGATDRPENIDAALLRAGRLKPHIEIKLPDTTALAGILRHHLREDEVAAIVASAPIEVAQTGSEEEQT